MKTGVRYDFSLLSGHYWSSGTEGRAGFQVAGGEAVKVSSKLTLFPLSVCPPFQNQYIVPRDEQCWSKRDDQFALVHELCLRPSVLMCCLCKYH